MRVLINDANILIDLVELDLVDEFTRLSYDLQTTDFVVNELNEEQQKVVEGLNADNKLKIIATVLEKDFEGIQVILDSTNGLSFEDCSVLYYAKNLSGVVLTGDGRLRRQARNDGLEVRGIIYLFDEFLKQGVISFTKAVDKLKELRDLNPRLPQSEMDKRIKLWGEEKHVG